MRLLLDQNLSNIFLACWTSELEAGAILVISNDVLRVRSLPLAPA